jgi:hypothetical protein
MTKVDYVRKEEARLDWSALFSVIDKMHK